MTCMAGPAVLRSKQSMPAGLSNQSPKPTGILWAVALSDRASGPKILLKLAHVQFLSIDLAHNDWPVNAFGEHINKVGEHCLDQWA